MLLAMFDRESLTTVKSRVLTRVTNYFFGFLGVHIYETWFKKRRGYIKEIRLGKLKLGWDIFFYFR